jgi:hypothetical protein
MRMRAIGAAAFLLLLGAASPARGPAGDYRLAGGPDTASEIVLAPDGRFRFFLMEGAVDLHAEGRWTLVGNRLRLDTQPKPIPPAFTETATARTADAPLVLRVNAADGSGIAAIDLRIGFDSGPPIESYTQEDGWSLPADETRTPRWVELGLEMYGLGYTRFPIDTAKANALTFVLTPNGLGVETFEGVDIAVEPGALVFRRGGGMGRYVLQAGKTRRRR